MSLVGYECACVDVCKCFDDIRMDPITLARTRRVSDAVERIRAAEYTVDLSDSEEFAIRLEAIAGEFGL